MAEHHDMRKAYFTVFGVLTVGTALTMAAAKVNFGSTFANILVAVAIASVKALLVLAIFMHLKYDERALRIAVFFPLCLLVVFVLGNIPDTSIVHFNAPPEQLEKPYRPGEFKEAPKPELDPDEEPFEDEDDEFDD